MSAAPQIEDHFGKRRVGEDRGPNLDGDRPHGEEVQHVRKLDEKPVPGETEIPATDERGAVIAHFAWRPLNPGYAMLRQLLPPIGLVFVGLTVIAVFQLRRIKRLADDLIEREAQNRDLAYHDPATGLPNRLYFREQLALELAALGSDVGSLAVLCIGFDGLREIGDEFGNAASEEFLGIAARRLGAVLRDDVVLARTTEDGFAIVALGATERQAQVLGDRLRQSMNAPLALERGRVELRCSVVSVVIDDPALDAADVLRQAESALCRAQAELPLAAD